ARARAALSLGMGKWDIGGSVIAETAGLLNPVADLDAYMRYRLAATLTDWPVVMAGESGDVLPHGDFEVGIESEFGLVDELGMRRLELFTGVPLAFRTFELRPYVAFDFAPTVLDGLAPLWSSHGVDLTLITCCGSVTVGYLNDRGNWSASLSVDLERRPVLEEPWRGGGLALKAIQVCGTTRSSCTVSIRTSEQVALARCMCLFKTLRKLRCSDV